MDERPPWSGVFEVVDAAGVALPNQGLPLTQVNDEEFVVGATLRYLGPTGLSDDVDEVVRILPFSETRRSDLASVPAVVRWFERPHGVHTPAALFHDYFITSGSPISSAEADRYFLNMLGALGVPTVKRWVMYAAVALRTRWVTNKLALLLWIVLSATGLGLFVWAALGLGLPDFLDNRGLVLVVSGLAPLPASLLWGSQWQAALVAAVVAIWILPASALALVALAVYYALESVVGGGA